MSVNVLTKYREQALTAQEGISPYPKPYDYVEGHDNPYLNRYIPEEWEEKIKKVSRNDLICMACGTELVKYIDCVAADAFKGTPFEKLMFGHTTC